MRFRPIPSAFGRMSVEKYVGQEQIFSLDDDSRQIIITYGKKDDADKKFRPTQGTLKEATAHIICIYFLPDVLASGGMLFLLKSRAT